MTDLGIPIESHFLQTKETIRAEFHGRLTAGGEETRGLLQGGILRCREAELEGERGNGGGRNYSGILFWFCGMVDRIHIRRL